MALFPRVAPRSPTLIDEWSREPNLDLLRAIAVLCVVVRHLAAMLAVPSRWWFQPQALGIFGVLIFFVHTSLVLMVSLDRQTRATHISPARLYVAFLVRRLFRIYPLSITVVLLIYFVLIPRADPTAVAAGIDLGATRGELVTNLLLVQDLAGRNSILAPLWSLPAEVQMYLVLPALFFLVQRRGARAIALVVWPLAVAIAVASRVLNLRLTVGHYAPCFVAGVLCYGLLKDRRPLPYQLFPVTVIAVLLAYMAVYGLVGMQAGLGIFVTLGLACAIPSFAPLRGPALRLVSHTIAKYSYGTYLFHSLCIWLAFGEWRSLGLVGSWLCVGVLIAATSVASYHVIERPLIRVGQGLAARITSQSVKRISSAQRSTAAAPP
jgi:peptidoglycan/LPS O-acetylase OafA/YrhL